MTNPFAFSASLPDRQKGLHMFAGRVPANRSGFLTGLWADDLAQACNTHDEADADAGRLAGPTSRAVLVGTKSSRIRTGYANEVAKLTESDRIKRNLLKARARAATPPEIGTIIEAWRPDLGPKVGSGGRAFISNPAANRVGHILGRAGRGAGVIGALAAAEDILMAKNRMRALVANTGAGIGGTLAGGLDAAMGDAAGPTAPVAAPAGGIAGSMIGGRCGYRASERPYDLIAGR